MTIPRRFALLALMAGAAPVSAGAQDSPELAPMKATAAAAPLAYESAFAGYRGDKELVPVAWKDSNARVAQPHDEHAGHDMGAMKHGHHAKPAPAPAPEPKNKDPHQGHQHKE
ncbi:hypothetical protein [Massilia soli]|uniref:Copper resistance protein CopB n=1 Tax=Massilia soli TaxID=2792854 RepID=A0ABS7SUW5_9BURK|nr:hypothetical protein [Massilia soli]MBZ2209746.1 hypothetical protein [Massilia soli]